MTLPRKFHSAGLLSTSEVAKKMRVHRSTVWNWIKSGSMKSVKDGPVYGVTQAELVRFSKALDLGLKIAAE